MELKKFNENIEKFLISGSSLGKIFYRITRRVLYI